MASKRGRHRESIDDMTLTLSNMDEGKIIDAEVSPIAINTEMCDRVSIAEMSAEILIENPSSRGPIYALLLLLKHL